MAKWISAKKKLPNTRCKEFRYLVSYRCPRLGREGYEIVVDIVGYGLVRNDNARNKQGWRWENHFYELGPMVPCNTWIPDDWITHWMTLPKPPRVSP